ncbi:MAG: PD-(D/E)XK nuclease family protein [Saprospiraceae bacterium]
MTIYFGLQLDDLVFPKSETTIGNTTYLGKQGLLHCLELHLGLSGHPNNNEHLRIEQYRQALQINLRNQTDAFYKTSFEADQFATSTTLLLMRDELLLEGWNFESNSTTPQRLKTISAIENIFNNPENDLALSPGFSDRFQEIVLALDTHSQPFTHIFLNESLNFLPQYFQVLLKKLEEKGAILENSKELKTSDQSDLSTFQKVLKKELSISKKHTLKNDGSILLIKSKRETHAAAWLASFFLKNKNFQPLCLIPEKSRALDNAFIQEGLPSLGILSASLARPSLQILKLVTTFLWQPIDPYKILEFVSLSVKPLADDLALEIARVMAQTPGINSDRWHAMTAQYFKDLEEKGKEDSSIDVREIKNQYDFWFGRTRYRIDQKVPKEEAIVIFNYLENWASQAFKDSNDKNTSMQVLSSQATRVKDLLMALPDSETHLTNLELERIVRTIYEPSPIQFRDTEVGNFPFVHQSSAILDNVNELLWWNFSSNEPDHFFSRWYQSELDFLAKNKIHLMSPEDKNRLLIWQRGRPILRTQKRLILVMPEMVDGSPVFPHPLHDVLEATFENMEIITFDVDTEKGKEAVQKHFETPQKITLEKQKFGRPKPFINIQNPDRLLPDYEEGSDRNFETFTSLESLFYYPYQWVFRHKIKLHKSSILSIVRDTTMMGNLSHRFFELLFREDLQGWNKRQVEQWIDEKSNTLLAREGAVMLMYGRGPERISFLNKIKYASWSLVSMIQKNGWKVQESEMDLQGQFNDIDIRAKADLVLEKGDEKLVIDLKWRGATRRKMMIKNEEDLQLVMYSKLLTADETWAHTAYFILEEGKMIARNSLAINEVEAVAPDSDHININQSILEKMEKTYNWRLTQLKRGQIEVRTEHTKLDLEEAYSGELFDLLEMKDGGAFFDDYRTLIDGLD